MLNKERGDAFNSEVKIEISVIQRILRDIEKFKSYHFVAPIKEQWGIKVWNEEIFLWPY